MAAVSARARAGSTKPWATAKSRAVFGARVASAVRYLRRSPCTWTWERIGSAAWTSFSMLAGVRFFPPAVMMMCFFRSLRVR